VSKDFNRFWDRVQRIDTCNAIGYVVRRLLSPAFPVRC
jgi:hypothetical protein